MELERAGAPAAGAGAPAVPASLTRPQGDVAPASRQQCVLATSDSSLAAVLPTQTPDARDASASRWP